MSQDQDNKTRDKTLDQGLDKIIQKEFQTSLSEKEVQPKNNSQLPYVCASESKLSSA